jgi:cytochrome P450 family 2 subfamily U polypeptide 1
MTLNPDIQKTVQTEIDDVMHNHEQPRMQHRSQLPFTEACLNEIQRLGDIVPLGVPHATTEDVNFMGFHLPKNTMIMPNMYSVHHDPKYWPNPDKFDPGRFLDDDGKVIKRDELIPFSIGIITPVYDLLVTYLYMHKDTLDH